MFETPLLPEFKTCPAVFAVGNEYQIMVPVKSPVLFFVEINGRKYYDHSNGIIRSDVSVHRVTVPMSELDKAGEYTVGYRKIIERKPYFSQVEEPVSATYKFRPVPTEGTIKIYHLSDTHGDNVATVAAGQYFGEDLDLLILNGDTLNDSGCVENFDIIFDLCAPIAGGERTCVFSRGNHDLRGICAEQIENYTPTNHGLSYYTIRVGAIWMILVDCAEDKPDSHEAYGYTNCCHEFRLEETEFIKDVIANADTEYNAPGVKYRLVVSHVPFTHVQPAPFDIEQELYAEWTRMIGENIKPHAMICGHLHTIEISFNGGRLDNGGGQFCPVIIASKPMGRGQYFIGSAITLDEKMIDTKFTDNSKRVVGGGSFGIEK